MTKAEKISVLARAFQSPRHKKEKLEGETDAQFVKRIVEEYMAKLRLQFLKNQINMQLSIENPKAEIDVTDL